MAWVAKQIVDANLQESPRFLAGLFAFLAFLYFGIYKLLFRLDIESTLRARYPAPAKSGMMADVRRQAGDRDLLEESRNSAYNYYGEREESDEGLDKTIRSRRMGVKGAPSSRFSNFDGQDIMSRR